ncbi:MAG: class I SAM-dependent methyltransferase [Candidatus Omnitrophota bacterium]
MTVQIDNKDLKNFYDNIYAQGDIRDNDKLYRWIINLLKPVKGKSLLDVSCGGGWLLKEASRRNLVSFGFDISSFAVENSKNNSPNSGVFVANGERIPFKDSYFDYLTCLGSLEHFIHPEAGVQEIKRVLKNDGKAIIILPNKYPLEDILKIYRGKNLHEPWQILERAETKDDWKAFLEQNGLVVLKTYRYNKYPEFFQRNTLKIKSIRKFFKTFFLYHFSPLSFSQQFVFICKKV